MILDQFGHVITGYDPDNYDSGDYRTPLILPDYYDDSGEIPEDSQGEIVLHPGQSEVYEDLFISRMARYATVVASRGWGKSYFGASCGMTATWELLELDASVPNKNVYIIAPTFSQVKDIYYPLLAYQFGAEAYANTYSRDNGFFKFPKDITLKLVSFEAIERLRGTGAYFVVNDEVSSWNKGISLKGAWEGIIQPCITTRWSRQRAAEYGAVSPGRAVTISTPKGFNYLYDMYNMPELDPDWKSYHFDYTKSPYLDADEIERVKHTIAPLEFNREYWARFEGSGNNVFYMFDRNRHVLKASDQVKLQPEEDVLLAIDFNVGIQATSAWVLRNKQLFCFDQFKGHPDTEQLAASIKARYPGHRLFGFPDPAGRARKTSAPVGQTDFNILEKAGIKCIADAHAPAIVDSVNCVNARLGNVAGEVNMFINASCDEVIKSLERTSWLDGNPDSAMIDKKQSIEHFSDGIRYMVAKLFPIRRFTKPVSRGFGF